MVQKKWIIIAGAVTAIIIVSLVGLYFFMVGFFRDLFTPTIAPLDLSGIDLPQNLTTEGLLPTQLANKTLNEEKVFTGPAWGYGTFGEYNVTKTSAHYDGIIIEIIKADDEPEASFYYARSYDREDFFDDVYGHQSKFRGLSWFTYDADDISGVYWKSGIWVFRVESEDQENRNQAAEEFVQELEDRSSLFQGLSCQGEVACFVLL